MEWCIYRVCGIRRGGVFERVGGNGGRRECVYGEFVDGGIGGDSVGIEGGEREGIFDDEVISGYDIGELVD